MDSNMDNRENKPKIFVLGVDGATFDVILPLVEKGELPNLKKMIDQGTWGELESVIPPSSGPAWTSFQTGKIPSNHGIFDFLTKRPKSYDTHYINSTNIRGEKLWDILGRYGLKSGIINVMVTYPPYPVNGFLLTGGLTPMGSKYAYPDELAKEIEDKFGAYRLWGVGGVTLTSGGEEKFINSYFSNEKRRIEIVKYLMAEKDWDFFMVMLESADPLQHELWKYIDSKHPRFDEDAPDFIKDAVPNFYNLVDTFLGEVLGVLPPNATVCIMSDHGFGPLDRYFLVNNFLMDIGMLKLKTSIGSGVKRSIFRVISLEQLYRVARRIGLNRAAKVFRGGARERALSGLVPSFKDIDWRRTKAFAVGASGHIYLNVQGREPEGIVKPGDEYKNVRDYIARELKAVVDHKTGNKAVEKVFIKEDLHIGRLAERAPDISFLPSRGFGTLHREQFVSPSMFIDSPSCGTHRKNGIVMICGLNIKKGKKIEGARIFDLAPTILYLFGIPIPNDIDGHVIREIFEKGHEPIYRQAICSKGRDKQKIRSRIKQLRDLEKL